MAEERGDTKVIFGGWYQRTTLHLEEIYQFLINGTSNLSLSKEKLLSLHKRLGIKSVSKESSYLDFVRIKTKYDIEIKYYEDGLYVLEMNSDNIERSIRELKTYFYEFLNPAVNYLFSLGAPTPKILSNIKDQHSIVIRKLDSMHHKFKVPDKFGAVTKEAISREMSVYKTDNYLFVLGIPSKRQSIDLVVEMQIFFSDFKEQLHKYLNIHRKVWENISDIKEKKYLRGKDVEICRSELESYKKTIDLINNRINQMSSYAHTRASLAKKLNIEENLIVLFQYKFEDLFNTLAYIKDIWQMTVNYVNSAISIVVEIASKNSVSGIRSIQILASIGVITTIVTYLTRDTLPTFTKVGFYYLIGMLVFVFAADWIIKRYGQYKRYELKFADMEKKL